MEADLSIRNKINNKTEKIMNRVKAINLPSFLSTSNIYR